MNAVPIPDLDALERAAQAATPGPWIVVRRTDHYEGIYLTAERGRDDPTVDETILYYQADPPDTTLNRRERKAVLTDAALISLMRNNIDALIALAREAETLRGRADKMERLARNELSGRCHKCDEHEKRCYCGRPFISHWDAIQKD